MLDAERSCTQVASAASARSEGAPRTGNGRTPCRSSPAGPLYTGFVIIMTRCRHPEIMDSPHLDERRHRRALDALQRINWISRSAAQLWADIRRVVPVGNNRKVRVLDVACGGGDVLLALEAVARRGGVALSVRGCDISPVAVARARERAAEVDSAARFFRIDALCDPLPGDADVIYNTLFLHHLEDADAISLLRRMADVARRMIVVQDLERSRVGYALAYFGVRVLTRSRVARVDGPLSVRAAFTAAEAVDLARRAGLAADVRHLWPYRYSLTWARP